jgi:hypothetical protein
MGTNATPEVVDRLIGELGEVLNTIR